MRLWVEREDSRAAVGGTGDAKVGGNYAASLLSIARLKERGYDQSLWLNPGNRRTVDELSGMNFFAVMDGALHTPALNGSIGCVRTPSGWCGVTQKTLGYSRN